MEYVAKAVAAQGDGLRWAVGGNVTLMFQFKVRVCVGSSYNYVTTVVT